MGTQQQILSHLTGKPIVDPNNTTTTTTDTKEAINGAGTTVALGDIKSTDQGLDSSRRSEDLLQGAEYVKILSKLKGLFPLWDLAWQE